MHALDPRLRRIAVDGETLIVPDESAWAVLEREGALEGRPIASGAILANHLALARRLHDVTVALGEERAPGKPFIVLHVAPLGGVLARMVIESATCLACEASVLVGVTRHYDLYMGTIDPLAAVHAHASDPVITCVDCGGTYTRPAVRVFTER